MKKDIKKISDQYEKLITSIFNKNVKKSIEDAIKQHNNNIEASIYDIVLKTLDDIRYRILDELGIDCGNNTNIIKFEFSADIDDEDIEDDYLDIDDEDIGDDYSDNPPMYRRRNFINSILNTDIL